MIEKINNEEIDKLYLVINKSKVHVDWIKGLLKIKTIADMDKLQYNFLLMILGQLYEI